MGRRAVTWGGEGELSSEEASCHMLRPRGVQGRRSHFLQFWNTRKRPATCHYDVLRPRGAWGRGCRMLRPRGPSRRRSSHAAAEFGRGNRAESGTL